MFPCFHGNSSFNMNTLLQYIFPIYIQDPLSPTSGHRTVCDSHETNDAPVLVKPAVKQQHPQRSVAIARRTEGSGWFLNLSSVTEHGKLTLASSQWQLWSTPPPLYQALQTPTNIKKLPSTVCSFLPTTLLYIPSVSLCVWNQRHCSVALSLPGCLPVKGLSGKKSSHMTITWPSHDCHMTLTWLSHDQHIAVTWPSHDHIRDACYLVEDRDDGETCFRCQEEVSYSLSLNTLKIKEPKTACSPL